MFASKRKVFNAAKARLAGTDAAAYMPKTTKASSAAATAAGNRLSVKDSMMPGAKVPNWKAQVRAVHHASFLQFRLFCAVRTWPIEKRGGALRRVLTEQAA